ncbi:hypothetical protein [Micromonospora sp. 067-2]
MFERDHDSAWADDLALTYDLLRVWRGVEKGLVESGGLDDRQLVAGSQ